MKIIVLLLLSCISVAQAQFRASDSLYTTLDSVTVSRWSTQRILLQSAVDVGMIGLLYYGLGGRHEPAQGDETAQLIQPTLLLGGTLLAPFNTVWVGNWESGSSGHYIPTLLFGYGLFGLTTRIFPNVFERGSEFEKFVILAAPVTIGSVLGYNLFFRTKEERERMKREEEIRDQGMKGEYLVPSSVLVAPYVSGNSGGITMVYRF